MVIGDGVLTPSISGVLGRMPGAALASSQHSGQKLAKACSGGPPTSSPPHARAHARAHTRTHALTHSPTHAHSLTHARTHAVMSAVSGLQVATSAIQTPEVVGITCVVLLLLFSVQHLVRLLRAAAVAFECSAADAPASFVARRPARPPSWPHTHPHAALDIASTGHRQDLDGVCARGFVLAAVQCRAWAVQPVNVRLDRLAGGGLWVHRAALCSAVLCASGSRLHGLEARLLPCLLQAVSPHNALLAFINNGFEHGWRLLGGVLLCVTGAHAWLQHRLGRQADCLGVRPRSR